MKYLIIAILALSLIGCASTKPPESVIIPISAPCTTNTPNTPTYRYTPPYDSVFDAVRDLLGDRELSIGYEKELEAALKSCK